MGRGVFISIGSNVGERLENCKKAIDLIASGEGILLVRKSSFYETSAWGKKDQPDFVNCVVEISTQLKPLELLRFLKKIESGMGRTTPKTPEDKWGPRAIDLDIIFYGREVVDEPDLEIPHPLAHERGFVLIPLCEIAPEAAHPVLKKTVKELASVLKDTGVIRKIEGA